MCKSNSRWAIGLVMILVGGVILAVNLDFFPSNVTHILLSWPMILIALGLMNLIKKEFTSAIIFFAVGGFFLMHRIDSSWSYHELWKFWPVLLIIVGASIIVRHNKYSIHHHKMSTQTLKDGLIDEVAIFGGRVTKVESDNFKGGKVTCVFGGGELHLEMTKIADEGAVLDISAVFGGVKIIVPRDWTIKVDVVSIFGGFADKRIFASNQNINNKMLTIKGSVIFGGGELSNL